MGSTFAKKVIDVVITVVFVLLIAFALLWFVHTFNVFELPMFIRRFIEQDSGYVTNVDSSEVDLLSLIESEDYVSDNYTYVSLTANKAKQLLKSVPQPSNYYWQVETSFSYAGEQRKQKHFIYKQNDKIRVDTDENGIVFTTVFSEGRVYSINNLTGEKSEFSGDTDFTYMNIVNIAALDNFFNDSEAVVKYVAVVDVGEEKFLYVEIPKGTVNGLDKYFVSLDHGMVMYASSSIDGIDYFTQKTVEYDADSVISDSAFEFNGSKAAEPLKLQ